MRGLLHSAFAYHMHESGFDVADLRPTSAALLLLPLPLLLLLETIVCTACQLND